MANRDLTPWRRQGGLQPFQNFARDPFTSFRREMDRLFDDFFAPAESRSFAPGQGRAQGMVMPSIDVEESEQAYTVTAELPGIDMKDVELKLDENMLTLSGEKRSERQEENGGRRYSERSYGRFERAIPFETEVDADRVEASFQNGVLKVMLPKNAQARDKSRRIQIKGEAAGGGGQGQPGASGAIPTPTPAAAQAPGSMAASAASPNPMSAQAPGPSPQPMSAPSPAPTPTPASTSEPQSAPGQTQGPGSTAD